MMFSRTLECITDVYDTLHHGWEHPRTQRRVALCIFLIYVLGLLGIELNRRGLLPPNIAAVAPTNHFHAISLAFTFILGLEIMGLILTISCSLSRSLGKQLEILALILLRDAFKVLSSLPEPVNLAAGPEPIWHIVGAGSSALAIFVCLGIYGRLRSGNQSFIHNPEERLRYVTSKKLMALFLFLVFLGFALHDGWMFIFRGEDSSFFETIYSVLIFSDIALVLIAQRFMPNFHAVFRNSGFVIATLIMRLSLSASWPWNCVASIMAALYVLALTWATQYFTPEKYKTKRAG